MKSGHILLVRGHPHIVLGAFSWHHRGEEPSDFSMESPLTKIGSRCIRQGRISIASKLSQAAPLGGLEGGPRWIWSPYHTYLSLDLPDTERRWGISFICSPLNITNQTTHRHQDIQSDCAVLIALHQSMAMSYSLPTSANTGDEPSGIEYEDWKNTLLQCLEGIGSFCEIASSSRYTMFPNPGLEIEGHPAFPLPLTSAHAQLIKNACRPASSGREANTPVDTPVQNIWELNRRQFKLLNPEWDAFLKEVATEAAHSLGLTDVGLMLHKLLLHEKGFSSQNYGDTEESPGKIGTLFICLPSEHSGGDVHISFGPDKHHFITAPTSKHDLTASAWYSDVSHKTKEINSGYRLALTYSIFQRGSDKKSAALVGQPTHMIRKHLLEWQTRFPDKETLIRPLDHSYSEAELSISHMKGYDRDVCRALHSVASECGVYLFFAHLRPVNSGPGRHGYNVDERDTQAIHRIMYSPNGKPIGFGYTPKPEEMLGLEGDLDNDDERSFTEEEDVEDASDYYRTVCAHVSCRVKSCRIRHGFKRIKAHNSSIAGCISRQEEKRASLHEPHQPK